MANYPEARIEYANSLTIARRLQDHYGEANSLDGLARVARELKDAPQAHEYESQALELYRQVGNVTGEANALLLLGEVEEDQNASTARQHYQMALERYEKSRNRRGQADVLFDLGRVEIGWRLNVGENVFREGGYVL